MTKGTVKWFSDQEGYGFISVDDENGDQKDIFVRYSDFECQGFKPVQKGVEVTFDIEEGENGPQAVRVCMAAGPHGGGGGYED